MMKRLRLVVTALVMLSSFSLTAAAMSPISQASAAGGCADTFMTFPAWYKGLQDGDCNFQPKQSDGTTDLKATIIIIVLNVANIILQLVGYAAAVMLIIGGFKYMTAQGESDKMAGAKKTITNSIIGLIISIMAVAIVNLVVGIF